MLHWLRVPKKCADLRYDEGILAIARLLMCIAIFGSGGRSSSKVSTVLLILYLSYSLAIILALYFRTRWSPQFYIVIYCIDILWTVRLILLIEWPVMFFALFLFIIAGAAFRWGFWECFFTMACLCVLLTAGGAIYYSQFLSPPMIVHYLWPDLLVCIALCLIIGFFEEAKEIRARRYTLSHLAENIHIEYTVKRRSK